MKHLFLPFLALTLLAACGKDNKSGKSDSFNFSDPYVGNVTSVPSDLVQRVLSESRCLDGSKRQQVNNVINFPSVIAKGDIYVGVTSFGDVAVLYGQGNQNPAFIGYLCNRGMQYQANLNPMNIGLGSYGNCQVKQLTRATIVFSQYPPMTAEFRMPELEPLATGRKFSICK